MVDEEFGIKFVWEEENDEARDEISRECVRSAVYVDARQPPLSWIGGVYKSAAVAQRDSNPDDPKA